MGPRSADPENVAEWPGVVRSPGALVYARRHGDDPWDTARIVRRPFGEGEERLLVDGGYGPTGTESGHLLFVRSAALYAVALDGASGSVIGAPAKVVPVLTSSSGNGSTSYSVSREGTLVYQAGGQQSRRLAWVDRRGVDTAFFDEPRDYRSVDISPDGSRVALYVRGGKAWVADTRRSTIVEFSRGTRIAPVWTPDGRSLTVSRFRSSASQYSTEISVRSIDGSEPERVLFTVPGRNYLHQWSPDRSWLLIQRDSAGTGTDILAIAASASKPVAVADSRHQEDWGAFSPDGRWVAYESNESGRPEVYVVPFGQPGEKVQVSSRGGQEPIWAANGRELFYRIPGEVFVVDVALGSTFRASQPRLLFKGDFAPNAWDVAPDGQRFLMIKEDAPPTGPLVVVEHFFEELERLAPHSKR